MNSNNKKTTLLSINDQYSVQIGAPFYSTPLTPQILSRSEIIEALNNSKIVELSYPDSFQVFVKSEIFQKSNEKSIMQWSCILLATINRIYPSSIFNACLSEYGLRITINYKARDVMKIRFKLAHSVSFFLMISLRICEVCNASHHFIRDSETDGTKQLASTACCVNSSKPTAEDLNQKQKFNNPRSSNIKVVDLSNEKPSNLIKSIVFENDVRIFYHTLMLGSVYHIMSKKRKMDNVYKDVEKLYNAFCKNKPTFHFSRLEDTSQAMTFANVLKHGTEKTKMTEKINKPNNKETPSEPEESEEIIQDSSIEEDISVKTESRKKQLSECSEEFYPATTISNGLTFNEAPYVYPVYQPPMMPVQYIQQPIYNHVVDSNFEHNIMIESEHKATIEKCSGNAITFVVNGTRLTIRSENFKMVGNFKYVKE